MKRKLLLMFISAILIVIVCINFIKIKTYNEYKYIMSPGVMHINNVEFIDNKFLFSGYVIGNSTYGDYTGYKYVVRNNKLYIMLCVDDISTKINENIEIEIIDDELYDVSEVYLKQGRLLRSIATR